MRASEQPMRMMEVHHARLTNPCISKRDCKQLRSRKQDTDTICLARRPNLPLRFCLNGCGTVRPIVLDGEHHTNEMQAKTNRYERRGKPQGNAPEMMADCVLETSPFPRQRWMLRGGDKTPPLLIIREYEFNASFRRCEKVGETKSTTTKV